MVYPVCRIVSLVSPFLIFCKKDFGNGRVPLTCVQVQMCETPRYGLLHESTEKKFFTCWTRILSIPSNSLGRIRLLDLFPFV